MFEYGPNGGPKGDRTPDLQIANLALSQLSYGPLCTYFSLFGGIFLSHLGSQLSYGPLCTYFSLFGGIFLSHLGSQLSYGPLFFYFSLFGGIYLSHMGSQLSYRPLSFIILSQQISPVNSFLSAKGASQYLDAPFQFTLRQDRSVLQFQSHRCEREPHLPRHTGRSFRRRDARYTVRSWQPQ